MCDTDTFACTMPHWRAPCLTRKLRLRSSWRCGTARQRHRQSRAECAAHEVTSRVNDSWLLQDGFRGPRGRGAPSGHVCAASARCACSAWVRTLWHWITCPIAPNVLLLGRRRRHGRRHGHRHCHRHGRSPVGARSCSRIDIHAAVGWAGADWGGALARKTAADAQSTRARRLRGVGPSTGGRSLLP